MKKFFRKFFFWDDPAAGAVFGWMLSVVFAFCLYNGVCFAGPEHFFPALLPFIFIFQQSNFTCFHHVFLMELQVIWIHDNLFGNHLLALLLLQLPVTAYSLFLFLAFFFRQDRKRFHWIFWTILAAHLALSCLCDDWIPALLLCVLSFAGFNALCVRKHNFLWYIALMVCWVVWLPGAAVLWDAVLCLLFAGEYSLVVPIPTAWRTPLVWVSVLSLIGFVFSNFKLWASANRKRLREVWCAGCNVLLVLFAVSYLTMTAAALYQQQQCKKALAALERNFQREISAEALKAFYYRDRKVDERFHIALRNAVKEFVGDDRDFQEVLSESAALERLPGQYRKRFVSPEAEKIGRFFDAPLPADTRGYSPGQLSSMVMPDLAVMQQAAKIFVWQIRIACENKDHAGAMLAWRRFARITDYLEHGPSLNEAQVLIFVEEIRLNGLEFMLSNNLLNDDELSSFQQFLRDTHERLPILARNVLYGEAVLGNDTVCGLEDGTRSAFPATPGPESLKTYRFLAPGMWYWAKCSYCALLKRYNVENLCKVNDLKSSSPSPIDHLAAIIIPAFELMAIRLHELEMRYQAFVVLIEAEKIKWKTGKYPESAPLNFTDHFGGKPLRYRVGSHTVRESFLVPHEKLEGELDAGNYDLEHREKTVQGVAVWSVGKNEEDDDGLADTRREYGGRTDDRRALLTTSRAPGD